MLHDIKGFTIIELTLVVVLVAIFAAISVPIMSENVNRARRAEAIGAMGIIRDAERAIMFDTGSFVAVAPGAFGTTAGINRYIATGDLNGKYYNDANYSVAGGFIVATGSGEEGCVGGEGCLGKASSSLTCGMNLATGEIVE